MKKTLFIAIFAIIAIFAMVANVQATEVTNGTDLKTFLEEGNTTIELTDNITLSEGISINNGNSITLKLNGKTLTLNGCSIEIKNGTLTVENGSIVSDNDAFRVVSAGSAILNIEANTEVTAVDNAVYIRYPGAVLNTKGNLTSTGTYATIQGNGSTGSGNVKVNILGGKITSKAEGVYFPNTTELNISNGTITGTTAVFHKSGKLTISGGELKGTGTKANYVHNSNGCDATGDALVIEASDYPGGVPEVSITGGTFTSTNNKAVGYYQQSEKYKLENEKFISGGTFSTDVSAYVANGLVCKKISDSYKVGKEHSITSKSNEGGKVTIREATIGITSEEGQLKDKGICGENVEVIAMPEYGYYVKSITGAEDLHDVAEYAYQFTMPDSDVVINVVFGKYTYTTDAEVPNEVANQKEVEEMLKETLANNKELAEAIEGKNVEIKIEVKSIEASETEKEKMESEVNKQDYDLKVTNYIEITIIVKDSEEGKTLGNLETVEKTITFTVPVPENLPEVAEGFERVYYIVRNHNGKIELLPATLVNGKIQFESDKFSTYAIAYKDVEKTSEEANNNNTGSSVNEEEVPQTGDSVIIYAVVALVAVAGIAVAIKAKRK